MENKGIMRFTIGNKKCLAVHGSLEDVYWKSITPADVRGDYSECDYVFSGHSHREHCFSIYYGCDNPVMRNEKKTTFINPGSIGQPRDHNPAASYVLMDIYDEKVEFCKAIYDIEAEQRRFSDKVDEFYKKRIEFGI